MTPKTRINQLVDHFFRHESGRLQAVLTRLLGTENIDLAEDVVQDTLVEAIKKWTYHGVPDHPKAWLYKVARNKTLNILKREQFKQRISPQLKAAFSSEAFLPKELENLFSEKEIHDDQLRMIFTCCHSSISPDSQIALALKTLCGFSIGEIAQAFLSNEENISKRLVRARAKIRKNKIPFVVPVGQELEERLKAVLETIYLLFNEGYKATAGPQLIRLEVADEAIRLALQVVSHPSIKDKATTYALLALMQLNAARFKARQDADGQIITLAHQDRSRWDKDRMTQGFQYLQRSEPHHHISKYHLLAIISAYHCAAPTFEATNWKGILQEYDKWTQIDRSPLVWLNRTIVLAKVEGAEVALKALQTIENTEIFADYHLYYSAMADFQMELERYIEALESLQKAYQLTSLVAEKNFLEQRILHCRQKINH